MRLFSFVFSLFLVIYSVPGFSATSCDPTYYECRFKFTIPNTTQFIYYYGNYDLSIPNSAIKRIIIGYQGTSRNAKSMFKSLNSATKAQKLLSETLIISPWLKGNDYNGSTTCTDGDCDAVEPNELYWDTDGWKQGDKSLVVPYISSFTLNDVMIQTLIKSKAFPSLQKFTITGHSAGGQFTQRYA